MKREINEWLRLIITLTAFFGMIVFITDQLGEATDKNILNQDRMLCDSAQISGNEKYLSKCECYYETNDIKCLQSYKNLTE